MIMYYCFFNQIARKCESEASWICLQTSVQPVFISLQDVGFRDLAIMGWGCQRWRQMYFDQSRYTKG